MAKRINILSAKKLPTLNEKGLYADGGNLYLQVTASGSKSWIFRYMFDGKSRYMGLGALHTVSLALARQKAEEARKSILEGVDPIESRNDTARSQRLEKAKNITFIECANLYIQNNEGSWKNPKHRQQWRSTLETYAFPVFGDFLIKDIDTDLIVKVLEPIWTTKTETASRLRGRIETILDWAKVRGMREGDNPALWKGHLNKIFPSPASVRKVKHHPSLPYSEINTFMSKIQNKEGMAAKCLYTLVLVGARSGEIRQMRWFEIDLQRGVWNAPDITMKMKKAHAFPLSKQAINFLKNHERYEGIDYVFPSFTSKSGFLSENAFKKIMIEAEASNYTVHGFRATFRTWAADQTSFPRAEVELCIAHDTASDVERAYQRSDLLEKRRRIMQAWADYCFTPAQDNQDNVVKIGEV